MVPSLPTYLPACLPTYLALLTLILISNLFLDFCFVSSQSDAYRVHVCEKCGFIAIANLKSQTFRCQACRGSKAYQVRIPYACKLLFQELMSMCIAPRIFTHRLRPHSYMPTASNYDAFHANILAEDAARRQAMPTVPGAPGMGGDDGGDGMMMNGENGVATLGADLPTGLAAAGDKYGLDDSSDEDIDGGGGVGGGGQKLRLKLGGGGGGGVGFGDDEEVEVANPNPLLKSEDVDEDEEADYADSAGATGGLKDEEEVGGEDQKMDYED